MGSFLDIAPDSPFPLQNLPYGVFSTAARPPRVGVAVGEWVVDLAVLAGRGLLPVSSDNAALFNHGTLRPFMLAG
ncbi:MAG: fumarylacetoacetase, partial [Phycisphaerales bacterium]|nr:fumarylacetoacetase [Phycisphaerales bacterium]